MVKAVITGAAGFTGFSLTKELLEIGYEVYAILRPGSGHNARLDGLTGNLHTVELDQTDFDRIADLVDSPCDLFFHLSWSGGRDDFDAQHNNVENSLKALESAGRLHCKRFIGIGSQAEYGICDIIITEDLAPDPINAYGAAKTAAMYLTKRRAEQLDIEWVWGRIFSLYGDFEPSGRMLPDLIDSLISGNDISLSSCEQYWDYLHVLDAAKAIASLGEKGHSGEIYNIANGSYRQLKEFVEEAKGLFDYKGKITYGEKAVPFISLKPDISKLTEHTSWKPEIGFSEGVLRFANEKN